LVLSEKEKAWLDESDTNRKDECKWNSDEVPWKRTLCQNCDVVWVTCQLCNIAWEELIAQALVEEPYDGRSRMMGDYHVRFCEMLRVKFPLPTR